MNFENRHERNVMKVINVTDIFYYYYDYAVYSSWPIVKPVNYTLLKNRLSMNFENMI